MIRGCWRASKLTHSCRPNCHTVENGKVLELRTLCDLLPKEVRWADAGGHFDAFFTFLSFKIASVFFLPAMTRHFAGNKMT